MFQTGPNIPTIPVSVGLWGFTYIHYLKQTSITYVTLDPAEFTRGQRVIRYLCTISSNST